MLALKQRSFSRLPILLLIAAMAALVFSCSEEMTGIDEKSGEGGFSGSGDVDPGAGGSYLLGSVSDTTFAPGYIQVWVMEVAYDEPTGMVSLGVELMNQTERSITPPVHFVITDIIPRDIAVVDFDGVSSDGFPYYDFSPELGDDGILDPGERTGRVTMKFHTVEPRSFAIGFRIDLRPLMQGGVIGGVVFRDDNQNGVRDRCDRCEPGIPRIVVALEKPGTDGDGVVLLTRTDANGEYRFGGLGQGSYKVFVEVAEKNWEVTSANPLLVTLVAGPDGEVQDFLKANFGLYPLPSPVPGNLFGPILVGPISRVGTLLDSVFVDPPSLLPVVYHYYVDVTEPPTMRPSLAVIDSASAWINGEQVFGYRRSDPPDSINYFPPQTIGLRDGLVQTGMNTIRLFTNGNEEAALMWRVYRRM